MKPVVWLAGVSVLLGFLGAGYADRYVIVLAWLVGVIAIRERRRWPVLAALYAVAIVATFVIPVWANRY